MIHYIKGHIERDGQSVVVYTDSVGEACGFGQYESGAWVELSAADEDFLASEPRPWDGRIFYECDEINPECSHAQCRLVSEGSPDRCRKTRDIRFARNFYLSSDGDFYEKL